MDKGFWHAKMGVSVEGVEEISRGEDDPGPERG